LVVVLIIEFPILTVRAEDAEIPDNFKRENLVAWCIVPFDAKKRNPAERAEMIQRLGLRRVAYDWRAEHVPQFEQEIVEYKKHGIEYFAFWSWHDAIEPLIKKHGIKPQIWAMCRQPGAATDPERIAEAAESLQPLVRKTQRLGLSLGIYNHGGWAGDPVNMVAICKHLRRQYRTDRVGIVYNFHHGHDHLEEFEESLQLMKPYLLCVNLNGMLDAERVRQDTAGYKIVPIGQGQHETAMIQQILTSGYRGAVGVLDHRPKMDAEESLRLNLSGLETLLSRRRSAKTEAGLPGSP
jgi:hypothetical protein